MSCQRTIKTEFSISGVGLHTGRNVRLKFKPAQINTGIRFVRVDLAGHPEICASPENVLCDGGLPRCTSIGTGDVKIHTVEHLMSVLSGMDIDNLIVEIDSIEIPGLDGSGLKFLHAFKEVGLLEQNAVRQTFVIKEFLGVNHGGASICVFPSDKFHVTYALDYGHPFLSSQIFEIVVDEKNFEKNIAPCRTFCLENESKQLRDNGLGKGANFDNTLVVGDNGVIKNQLRFKDEFARHKVFDLIGDLYLLGYPIIGHIYAVKSGHNLNIKLLNKISEQKKKYEQKGTIPDYDWSGKKEYGIKEIMEILPHRHPFLLVDRVIEIEKGKRAIGIKNVTINDSFFRGHFPTRPIMPGVLMVEAMAQTGGVVVLTNSFHRDKVAFFMAVDNVKFRKVVVPGDQLMMEVEVVKDKAKIAQIHAVSKVAGDIVAEADMVFSFTDASYLD